MRPTKSILDRSFKYVPAARTNIRDRFNRIRYEQEQQRRQAEGTPPLRRVK
jgi:hypothetical protein